ncbi:MAG: PorT family protein [Bacteroidales bacterium]|nr:PorT family protein [Bacteroidales bacterium]
MKKIHILIQIAILLFMTQRMVSAQSFGVKAGLNLSKTTDYTDEYEEIGMRPGINAGPIFEYNVADNFYVQFGLLFSQKGLKIMDDEEKINIYYLEIPINLLNKFEMDPVTLVYGVGPYFAYAIKSKNKYEGDEQTVIRNVDLGYNHDNDRFIPGDFGIGFNAGVEYSSIQINMEFGLGLTDIAHRYPSMFNRRFGISVGYLIN